MHGLDVPPTPEIAEALYIGLITDTGRFMYESTGVRAHLMAGELIVAAPGVTSLGQLLSAYQDQSLAADVLAIMVAILAVGLLMDTVVFSRLERMVLERRGLLASR